MIFYTENLTEEDYKQISDWIDIELKDKDPVKIGEYDFYVYPVSDVRMKDEVFNFYDSELLSVLKSSYNSKRVEYTHKVKKLKDTKLNLYLLIKNGVEQEYAGHDRLDDLVKMYWEWVWKVWSFQDMKDLKDLKFQISNLKLAIRYTEKLIPGHKEAVAKGWYTEDEIDEANGISILSLIGGKIRNTGNKSIVNCPFHSEKTGSFVIYQDNTYHCFGCSAHGNGAIDFVMKRDELSFVETIKFLLSK